MSPLFRRSLHALAIPPDAPRWWLQVRRWTWRGARVAVAGLLLLVLAVAACAVPMRPAPGSLGNEPSVTIENESNQYVRVYDGALLLALLPPGTHKTVMLQGIGLRHLTVRSLQWVTETRAEHFEQNRAWQLIVTLDGRTELNLRPGAPTSP